MKKDDLSHITLYTVIGDFDRVKKAFVNYFMEFTKKVDNSTINKDGIEKFIMHFKDDTDIEVNINKNQELVKVQTVGMQNYFAQVKSKNKKLHEGVLNQISVFNGIVGTGFLINDDEHRTNAIINTLFIIAKDINAIILMPDMSLYTGEGKLLFSLEGKSDYKEYTPIGNSDFLDQGKKETKEDIKRKECSFAILKEKDIPYIPHLRAAMMEKDAKIRSIEEIAKRLFAIFAVCVYSEARSSDETWESAQEYIEKVNEILKGGFKKILSPSEKKYLSVKKPTRQDIVKFGWRYEGCNVLLWALGFLDELVYPDTICDVPAIAKILWKQKSIDSFIKKAKLRTNKEILDAADLTLRYDWACVDARIKKHENPAGLDGGVVYERHYTFNWLIGANNNADWDNISTDT